MGDQVVMGRYLRQNMARAVFLGFMVGASCFTGLSPKLQAEEIPGSESSAVRPLGMGDAFTAVANDESAIWTNPSGIGRSRKARSRGLFNVTKFPNIIVGANGNTRDFYNAFSGAQDKSVASVLTTGKDLGNKPLWTRAGLFPVTLFDLGKEAPMAFGVYSNTVVSAIVPSDTPNVAQIKALSDLGAVVTFGWTNPSNRLNTAIQFRPVARYAFENHIPSDNLVNKTAMRDYLAKDSNKSEGFGIDVGMLYTIADFWFPTIGVSVLNVPTGCKQDYLNPYSQTRQTVCGNVFHGNLGNPDALSVVDPTDARVGLSITPRLTHRLNMRLALDAHNLPLGNAKASYGLQSVPFSALVHGGVELFAGNPLMVPDFAVRMGVNQGFITSGFTFNMGALDIDFATYGVDVSTTTKAVEDRRYLGSLSFNF
jgi:hypothetical protein